MPSYTLLHLFFTTGEVGINMFLSQEKKLRLTEVIQLARSGIVIRTSVYLGLSVGKSGSLGTVWLNQLPLLTDAPSGCQGPSDVLLMWGVSCLSSQGAACPAPSYVPMPCSGSWSSAGPTSPGSDPASAPSTRSCRASESDIGEAGPSSHARGLCRRDCTSSPLPAHTAGRLFTVLDSGHWHMCCGWGRSSASAVHPCSCQASLPGRSNKTTCACQVLFGMCAPLKGRS